MQNTTIPAGEESRITPMTFGEMLRFGGQLLGRTFLKASLLNLIVLVPLVVFFGDVARKLGLAAITTIQETSARQGKVDWERFAELFVTRYVDLVGLLYLSFFLLIVGLIWCMTVTTILNWNPVIGEEESFGATLRRSVGRPFWIHLLQAMFLLGLVWIFSIFATLFGAGMGTPLGDLPSFLFQALMLYAAAVTAFRVHEIVADGRGPWRGLVSSIAVARVDIARVLLTMVPMVLVVLAITTLVALAVAVRTGVATGIDPAALESGDPQTVLKAFREFIEGFVIWSLAVQGAVYALLLSAVTSIITALYTHLRARRGDFEPEADEIVTTVG